MKLKSSIFGLVFVCLVGCVPAGKIALVNAERPVLDGLTSVHGKAVISNAMRSEVTIESARFVAGYKGRELVGARLMLPVELPAGRTSPVRWDLAIEDTSLSNLQILQARAMTNPEQVSVDASLWVRVGCMRKKVEMKDVPLTRIITNFGTFQ